MLCANENSGLNNIENLYERDIISAISLRMIREIVFDNIRCQSQQIFENNCESLVPYFIC